MSAHTGKLRPHKGKSLLTFPNEYVVFDLETTGLDSACDSIIEIAAIKVSNNRITEEFQTLVNPDGPIDGFIVHLTGITNDMVADAPKIEEILPGFLDFVGDEIVIGHNVNFDVNFIYDACARLNLPPFRNDYVDTLRLSRLLCPEEEHHRLSDLVSRYGLAPGTAHRAMADVIHTNDCLMFLRIDEDAERVCCHGPRKHSDARQIHIQKERYCENPYILGKKFVFTGTLDHFKRDDAMQLVVDSGGLCANTVSRKVDFLVVGTPEYITAIHGGKNTKQKRAEELRLQGDDIQVISENVFLDMIGFQSENKEGCGCD